MISKEEKLLQINKGYMNFLSSEPEIIKALSDKYKQLAKEQPDSKWKNISEGFELGVSERKKERELMLKLAKEKKSRGKSQGRSR